MLLRRAAPSSSGHTILIVDDQEETLISSRMLLEREGHQVLTAASGAVALEVLNSYRVDLLLIDYFMPRMNGEQLVQAIRSFDQEVQVILQTGYSGEKPPREMMRSLDIQGYHDKADGPDRLLLWVDCALKASDQLRRVTEARAKLLESEQHLRRLSSRLLDVQEEERSRISSELHDQLGQLLTAIGLGVEWALHHCAGESTEILTQLKQSKRLTDEAIQKMRELCSTLRVADWSDRGLAASLRACASEFERRIPITVRFFGPQADEELDAEVIRNVCRIVQEALNNVARHAGATAVSISLRRHDDQWMLSLADNGAGFDTAKVLDSRATGLIGMRERARRIGAQFEVESVPGGGTRVRLKVGRNARVQPEA